MRPRARTPSTRALLLLSRALAGALFAILLCVTRTGARAAIAYQGSYVIVDPYKTNDLKFLKCATESSPVASCSTIGAQKSGFFNPFINNAANGVLLRLPWCGFQVAPAAGQPALPTPGECHYQLQGAAGLGAYVAGSFTGGGALQFAGEAQIDPEISNLSRCRSVVYDTCPSGVLAQALGYISTINQRAGGNLVVAFTLEAGQYTPRSVLDAGGAAAVGAIDLPQVLNKSGGLAVTSCIREPLAWQQAYQQDYTDAIGALARFIFTFGPNMPPLLIIKEGAITSNSIEFDIPARDQLFLTAIDPALPLGSGGLGNGIGPQGDPALQCPDQTPAQTGVNALLNAYAANGIGGMTLAQAYESAFGYIIGFETGLIAQNPDPDAIISIPVKGNQEFAHVACGLDGASACIPDPDPNPPPHYSWSEYYFTKFVNDLFVSGGLSATTAQAGFASACAAENCAPASYSLRPWQLSIVYTSLDPTHVLAKYTSIVACWLNNRNTAAKYTAPATLQLYVTGAPNPQSTMFTVLGPAPVAPAPGGGTMLGWQTATASGSACAKDNYSLQGALNNGGQFVEIETDAAAEPACNHALQTALAALLAGNQATGCVY